MEEFEIKYDTEVREVEECEAEIYAVVMTQEQLDELVKTAGKVAAEFTMKAMKDHADNDAAKLRRERQKQIKQILKSYRTMKQMVEEQMRFTAEEQADIRWNFVVDLVGKPSTFARDAEGKVNGYENRLNETVYLLRKIENALDLYEMDVEAGTEEDRRRLEELRMMYIDSGSKNVTEIAEEMRISEKIVYRDLGIAVNIMETYLF